MIIALFIPIWIATVIVRGALFLLGLVLIPLAVMCGAHDVMVAPYYEHEVRLFTWQVMRPFQNYEDGIDAGLEFKDSPVWVRILYWSMIRNPVNGFRWLPVVSTKIEPEKIKFDLSFYFNTKNTKNNINQNTKTSLSMLTALEEGVYFPNFQYFVRQGWYANYRIERRIGKYIVRFWIGNFKGYPSHKHGVNQTNDYQRYGSGPVLQLKIRKVKF